MQAKLLTLCALNLRVLFHLVNQKDEIGILNSMYKNQAAWLVLVYYESPSLAYYFLLYSFFPQPHLQSVYSTCLNLQFLLSVVSDFFMSIHMDKAKCVPRASYII